MWETFISTLSKQKFRATFVWYYDGRLLPSTSIPAEPELSEKVCGSHCFVFCQDGKIGTYFARYCNGQCIHCLAQAIEVSLSHRDGKLELCTNFIKVEIQFLKRVFLLQTRVPGHTPYCTLYTGLYPRLFGLYPRLFGLNLSILLEKIHQKDTFRCSQAHACARHSLNTHKHNWMLCAQSAAAASTVLARGLRSYL